MTTTDELLEELRAVLPDGWTVEAGGLGRLPRGYLDVPLGSMPGVERVTPAKRLRR